MIVELIGGPWDGRTLELDEAKNDLIVMSPQTPLSGDRILAMGDEPIEVQKSLYAAHRAGESKFYWQGVL